MKIKSKISILFSFLLISALFIPLQVSAAEKEQITRTQEFTTGSKNSYEKQVDFEQKITSDKRTYQLKEIKYKILETTYLDKKEKVVKSQVALKDVIKENGIEYKLVKSEQEEKVIHPKTEQTVTAFDDYDYAVTSEDVPKAKRVTAVDEMDGQQKEVDCRFSDIALVGTRTQTADMTITFEDYDAAYYEYNGNYIPKNDAAPALEGYDKQLLENVGAPEGSRITNIAWAGEIYESAEGVRSRDAVAVVQRPVHIYRATYQGVIITPEEKATVYKGVYEADDPDGRMKYTVKATASYERQVVPVVYYVLAGVGILICVATLVIILIILAKKRKEEKEK